MHQPKHCLLPLCVKLPDYMAERKGTISNADWDSGDSEENEGRWGDCDLCKLKQDSPLPLHTLQNVVEPILKPMRPSPLSSSSFGIIWTSGRKNWQEGPLHPPPPATEQLRLPPYQYLPVVWVAYPCREPLEQVQRKLKFSLPESLPDKVASKKS